MKKKSKRLPDDPFRVEISQIPVKPSSDQDRQIKKSDLSRDQLEALEAVVDRIDNPPEVPTTNTWGVQRLPIVTLGGYAGTGKSTLIPIISRQLGDTRATAFCAYTGKAANVMTRKLKAAGVHDAAFTGTIHRLIYDPISDEYGRIHGWQRKPRPLCVGDGTFVKRIIVDEASMVGRKLIEDLLEYNVPILAVGDHGQLPPVNDLPIMERPDIRLEKIHRQAEKNPIIQLATSIRQSGDMPKNFPESANVRFVRRRDCYEVVGDLYERFGLNMAVIVRRNMVRNNFNILPRESPEPSEGDIVMCLKNAPPIYNGMRGVVHSTEPDGAHWYRMSIDFPDDGLRVTGRCNKYQFGRDRTIESVYDLRDDNIKYYDDELGLLFDFGLALTCHKSQGSAFEEVVLCPEKWSNDTSEEYGRWLYTAVTRASKNLTITHN